MILMTRIQLKLQKPDQPSLAVFLNSSVSELVSLEFHLFWIGNIIIPRHKVVTFKDQKISKSYHMAEYSQSWRKKLRIKLLVEIAQNELKDESYDENNIKRIQEKLDLEMKTRWKLIKNTRKDYLESVEKILRKEYVLNV